QEGQGQEQELLPAFQEQTEGQGEEDEIAVDVHRLVRNAHDPGQAIEARHDQQEDLVKQGRGMSDPVIHRIVFFGFGLSRAFCSATEIRNKNGLCKGNVKWEGFLRTLMDSQDFFATNSRIFFYHLDLIGEDDSTYIWEE